MSAYAADEVCFLYTSIHSNASEIKIKNFMSTMMIMMMNIKMMMIMMSNIMMMMIMLIMIMMKNMI